MVKKNRRLLKPFLVNIRLVSDLKNSKICAHTYANICTTEIFFTDCLIYCILSNGEVIKYHIFISEVVIELSVRDILIQGLKTG